MTMGRWLLDHAEGDVFAFLLAGLVLTPVWKAASREIKQLLDPRTPGGVGDIPDADGVKAHERLASK